MRSRFVSCQEKWTVTHEVICVALISSSLIDMNPVKFKQTCYLLRIDCANRTRSVGKRGTQCARAHPGVVGRRWPSPTVNGIPAAVSRAIRSSDNRPFLKARR